MILRYLFGYIEQAEGGWSGRLAGTVTPLTASRAVEETFELLVAALLSQQVAVSYISVTIL